MKLRADLAIGVKTVLILRPMTTMWGAEAFLGSLSLSGDSRPCLAGSEDSHSELRRRILRFMDSLEDKAWRE